MPMFPINLGFRELEASRDLIRRRRYVLGFLLALASVVANVVVMVLVLNFAATMLVGQRSLPGAGRSAIAQGVSAGAKAQALRRDQN